VKLLIDEMWTPVVAEQLRQRGYDARSVIDPPSLRNTPDLVLFRLAFEEGRVLVTENSDDFRQIASQEFAAGREHAGLVFTDARSLPRGNPRSVGRLVSFLESLMESDPDLTNIEVWAR
jgi:hypothetical protein